MPNIAFDLEVFRKVAATTPVPGDSKFAQLGALGPDLFEYLPISSKLSDALHNAFQAGIAGHKASDTLSFDLTAVFNDSALARELFEQPMMAAYSLLFREIVVDFWPVLQRDLDILGELQIAANNQDETAINALKDKLQQLADDAPLRSQLGLFLKGFLSFVLQFFVAIPPAIQSTEPGARPWLPQSNRLFEFLRWHHTDRFVASLTSTAANADQQGYAFGFLCHIAASVTGRPFMNNINGGPYRTHWWRNRYVSSFVDAWTYGRYETPASMSGDTPTPSYDGWKNIRTANLQDRFNLAGIDAPAGAIPDVVKAVATGQLAGFPGQFPQPLASYVQAAIDAVYPANARPAGYTPDVVKQSFTGLFAVVWFMTGGFGPSSWRATDLGDAPSACPTAPSWVGGNGTPPSPQSGPGIGDILAGIVFAICALIDFIFGSWEDGVALLKNAIGHFGSQTDWDQFQCNTYWLRKGLLDSGIAAVEALSLVGLAYPLPEKLGTVDVNGITHPALDNEAADNTMPVPLTKTNAGLGVAGERSYPHQMDASVSGRADRDFVRFPLTAAETPTTLNLSGDLYPDAVVDGLGLQNGGMLNDHVFPSANQFFGDAVSNIHAVITAGVQALPSFNLDADRGYGWKTWTPEENTFPGSGQIDNPQPEP